MLIVGFEDYDGPARRLAAALRTDYVLAQIHRFPDGESKVRLPPSLPPQVLRI